MGFFSRGDHDDAEQSESLARIEQGGIPAGAERRLQELAAEGSLFTSGLSVGEFALLDRMGPQPLAQVMGASVVRTGWQYLPALDPVQVQASWYGGVNARFGPTMSSRALQNRYGQPSWNQLRNYLWHTDVVCELDVLSDAWMTARRRALDRLTEEALQVGADAVVGVHLRRDDHDLGKRTIEYVVTGTAVRLPRSSGASWPILTDLSAQDYWRLHAAGQTPVGLLATTVVLFASPSRSTRLRRLRTTRSNQELEELTRAFQAARETVRARLGGQVSDAQGDGAVGVTLSHAVHRDKFAMASAVTGTALRGWHRGRLGIPYLVSGKGDADREGWVITMHGAGTAIRRRLQSEPQPPLKTSIRMGGPK
jgi:uncharacterized protein YbjQ (UPF0145 family)